MRTKEILLVFRIVIIGMLPDQETGDNQLSDLYAAVQAVIALADPVSARNRSLEIGEAT